MTKKLKGRREEIMNKNHAQNGKYLQKKIRRE